MPQLLPDQTFYPSPTMAMAAPVETFAYIALLNPDPAGKDAMGVIDVDPGSNAYGSMTARVDMPGAGDELHHFGWNACSSCLCPYSPHPHMKRRYLVVPGPAILAHPHPRHRARSAPSPGREGHRARRDDGEDRIQPAPHVALRAGRHLHERHRQQGWRWPGRHLRARSRDVRDQGRVGARSRPAVSRPTTSGGTSATTR